MAAYVVLDDLGHQPVDGTAHRRNQLKNICTARFGLERTLNRLHLSSNTSDSRQESRFVLDGVAHRGGPL